MKNVADIITRRSPPGLLIFDKNAELLFSNPEASELLAANTSLGEEVRKLCDHLKNSPETPPEKKGSHLVAFCGDGPPPHCAVRAFTVGEKDPSQKHIIVLLEKVVERRSIDIEEAKKNYNLSRREVEVLSVLNEGLSNKEISERLFISQLTVKDHVRNIMRKVGVTSRGALIAALQ